MKPLIAESIKKHFSFLEQNYSAKFKIISDHLFSYEGGNFIIRIGYDRGDILVDVGQKGSNDFIALSTIMKSLGLNDVFQVDHSSPRNLDNEIEILSKNVKKYCQNFLDGEFNSFEEIKKYQQQMNRNWLESLKIKNKTDDNRLQEG